MTAHVRGPGETGGAIGFALIFLVLFGISEGVLGTRQKEQRSSFGMIFIYFLLLVQKKVTKKSTPATIYSRCRTP
jgi:hypothetical protein